MRAYAADGMEYAAAGVDTILLAGSPGHEFEPDGYLNMKIDAAATLAELLTKLGA